MNADRMVVQCSDAGALLLGVPYQQALGHSINQLLQQRINDFGSADDLDWLVDKISSPAPTAQDAEIIFRRPGYRRLKVTVFPLTADNGNDGAGLLVRDLTLDTDKDDFLSILSHELLNTITSVIGYSELLRNATLDQIQSDWLETIHSSGQRLAELVEDLQEVSRVEQGGPPGTWEIFSLNQAIDEVSASTELRAGFGEFETRVDPHLPMVKTNRKALGVILRNLLRNATDHAPSGSKVTLTARQEEESGRVVISVKDLGQGIVQTGAYSVFTPFYQGREPAMNNSSGNPLCLFIAKSLVEDLGGEIWLESGSREGAIFHFSLAPAPLNAEPVPPTGLSVTTRCE